MGDPEAPNILLYEAAEGSLGILSQFVEDMQTFPQGGGAGQSDLPIRRSRVQAPGVLRRPAELLQPARPQDHRPPSDSGCAGKAAPCAQSRFRRMPGSASYEDQYQAMCAAWIPTHRPSGSSSNTCIRTGFACPMRRRSASTGSTCQPDFYYEPRIWVFCDGTPHDEPDVQEDDDEQAPGHHRSEAMRSGSGTIADDLAEKIAARPTFSGRCDDALLQPGKLVSLRGREWVVLPSEDPDLLSSNRSAARKTRSRASTCRWESSGRSRSMLVSSRPQLRTSATSARRACSMTRRGWLSATAPARSAPGQAFVPPALLPNGAAHHGAAAGVGAAAHRGRRRRRQDRRSVADRPGTAGTAKDQTLCRRLPAASLRAVAGGDPRRSSTSRRSSFARTRRRGSTGRSRATPASTTTTRIRSSASTSSSRTCGAMCSSSSARSW